MLDPRLNRREFLAACAATTAVSMVPLSCRPDPRFFTDDEFALLEALVDRIIPPDHDPGAADLGAANYIERMLTAFDGDRPKIFAGGPFSGRHPFPNYANGTPSTQHPINHFRRFLAPSPLQDLFWRTELFGSEVTGLPAHLDAQRGGPRRGLRELYREGLAGIDAFSVAETGEPFTDLSTGQQDVLFARLDAEDVLPIDPSRGQDLIGLLIRHTLEGCFSAPEYGGNADGAGWRMVGIEGDNQPLGYALFSLAENRLIELEDHPVSTPNPDEIAADGSLAPLPLSEDGKAIQDNIAQLTGLLERLVPGACG